MTQTFQNESITVIYLRRSFTKSTYKRNNFFDNKVEGNNRITPIKLYRHKRQNVKECTIIGETMMFKIL